MIILKGPQIKKKKSVGFSGNFHALRKIMRKCELRSEDNKLVVTAEIIIMAKKLG